MTTPVPGHRLISAHRCICGWEGDNAITHIIDALQAAGWDLVAPRGSMTTYREQMIDAERTLDKLDVENDDNARAILIDHMIELSDLNVDVAEMWKEYR